MFNGFQNYFAALSRTESGFAPEFPHNEFGESSGPVSEKEGAVTAV